jgi:DNA-binding LytR/AlgR family response regulator
MDDIIALEAAGDYVSLHVGSGRKVLANASLTALESELPDNFIRVHRSFLVNADKIVSLKRLPQGTGELVLTAGTTIPVSRRILPQLRKSLQSE